MAKSQIIAAVLIFTLFGIPVNSQTGSPDYLLPRHTIPRSYELWIIPHLNEGTDLDFTIEGTEAIEVEVLQATPSITFHMKDITIDISTLKVVNQETYESIPILGVGVNPDYDFFTIELDRTLQPGVYRISLMYKGKIRNDLVGMYRSSYLDLGTGTTKWIATTHFLPTRARMAYPCFDEPFFKATFNISIARFPHQRVISNTQLQASTVPDPNNNNRLFDRFATTKPMCSYLLVAIVSEFDFLTDEYKHRVNAEPDSIHKAQYALSLINPALEEIENFTGVAYPLSKLEISAIPDFLIGGMQNWGAITYRAEYILYAEGADSPPRKFYISRLVIHEVIHHWFGDLVSLAWWKYAWIQEGLTSYIEFEIVTKVESEWVKKSHFLLEIQNAMSFDTDANAHSLTSDVYTPDEIFNHFDDITYVKGSVIFYMTEKFLTWNTWRGGLNKYLTTYAYGTADTDNFYSSMQQQVDEDGIDLKGYTVKEILDSWALKIGYPVVTVTRNYEDGTASATQARFLKNETDGETFYVPLSYTSQTEMNFDDTRARTWLIDSSPVTLESIALNSNEWLIVNLQVAGYYRVNYDHTNWNLISEYLRGPDYTNIHEMNRAQLVDDAEALAGAGLLPTEIFHNLLKYLEQETEYVPWKTASNVFEKMNERYINTPSYPEFKELVLTLMKKQYLSLGLAPKVDDSPSDILKREIFVSWACYFGEATCTAEAAKQFHLWKTYDQKLRNAPKANVAMMCSAVKTGSQSDWLFLWNEYKYAPSSGIKMEILEALGCTTDEVFLNRYLHHLMIEGVALKHMPIMGPNHLNYQPFGFLKHNVSARSATLEFLINNTKAIPAADQERLFSWYQKTIQPK